MRACLLLVIAGLMPIQAHAQRLDDSLSPRKQLKLDVEWKYGMDSEDIDHKEFNALVARAEHVETRLNTADFVGKDARIFLELPSDIRGFNATEGLILSWTTNDLFEEGTVTLGNRRLIFEGAITEDVMTDIFDFTIEVDGRYFFQEIQFEPIYEIEVIR